MSTSEMLLLANLLMGMAIYIKLRKKTGSIPGVGGHVRHHGPWKEESLKTYVVTNIRYNWQGRKTVNIEMSELAQFIEDNYQQ